MNARAAVGDRGFTLLELQVALLLTALVSLLLTSGIGTATRVWARVSERQDSGEHLFLVNQVLRNHLTGMRFITLPQTDAETELTSFWGDERSLRFVAPWISFPQGDDSLYWWELKTGVNPDDGNDLLVLEYWPFEAGLLLDEALSGSDPGPQGLPRASIVVARDMVVDAVAYYGTPDASARTGWYSDWPPGAAIPRLVEVRLALERGDGELVELPGLVIMPRFGGLRLGDTGDGL